MNEIPDERSRYRLTWNKTLWVFFIHRSLLKININTFHSDILPLPHPFQSTVDFKVDHSHSALKTKQRYLSVNTSLRLKMGQKKLILHPHVFHISFYCHSIDNLDKMRENKINTLVFYSNHKHEALTAFHSEKYICLV